jgi:hypothetical protein
VFLQNAVLNCQTTRCHNPEDHDVNFDQHENLKSLSICIARMLSYAYRCTVTLHKEVQNVKQLYLLISGKHFSNPKCFPL